MDYKPLYEYLEPRSLKNIILDVKDSYGNTLLHRFVLNNSTSNDSSFGGYIGAILRFFSGVSVNARNKGGYTALHLALKKQNFLMAEKILTRFPTIDVNVKSSIEKETALHMAADSSTDSKDAIAVVKFLIRRGADVNAQDIYLNTPLHLSVKNNALEIVKVLVESSCMLNCQNHRGDTPLHIAAREGYLEIAKELVKRKPELEIYNYGDKRKN